MTMTRTHSRSPRRRTSARIGHGGGTRSARSPFASVDEAVATIRRGGMVIVVDDEDRENEGDLTIAAEKVTPKAINFMMTHGRGLICMPMTGERLDQLRIPLMVTENTSSYGTAFCVSVEASRGVSTGISAADRARTVLAASLPVRPRASSTRRNSAMPGPAASG